MNDNWKDYEILGFAKNQELSGNLIIISTGNNSTIGFSFNVI